MGRDLYKATLVHYVKETSGELHDAAVADLINVAGSLSLVPGFGEPTAGAYAGEAHLQWRNRDSCKTLLDGPSAPVRELLAEMKQVLKA